MYRVWILEAGQAGDGGGRLCSGGITERDGRCLFVWGRDYLLFRCASLRSFLADKYGKCVDVLCPWHPVLPRSSTRTHACMHWCVLRLEPFGGCVNWSIPVHLISVSLGNPLKCLVCHSSVCVCVCVPQQ